WSSRRQLTPYYAGRKLPGEEVTRPPEHSLLTMTVVPSPARQPARYRCGAPGCLVTPNPDQVIGLAERRCRSSKRTCMPRSSPAPGRVAATSAAVLALGSRSEPQPVKQCLRRRGWIGRELTQGGCAAAVGRWRRRRLGH